MELNINGSGQTAKRVLCVHSGGPVPRGSEYALLDFLATLKRQGREVRLLCDRPALHALAQTAGIPTDLIPPIVVHLHTPHTRRYLALFGVRFADLVIHCSELVRVTHEERASFKRSVTLRNAVDERRFAAVAELRRPAAAALLTLGFIGSISPQKGVDVLLEAVRLLHARGVQCRLRLAGAEETDAHRLRAEKLAMPVEFLGKLEREQIGEFLGSVHVHVLPSLQEGMPLSIIEAAYAGVPTVATAVGGIPEAMMHGRLGLLYKDNTPDELARTLAQMLGSAEWMSAARSREIAELSRNEFSLTANSQRLGALFDSLVPETAA